MQIFGKIIKFIIKNKYLLILLAIVLLSYWLWYFKFEIITHGDWKFWFRENLQDFFSLNWAWTNLLSTTFGQPVSMITIYPIYFLYGFLAKIGFSYSLAERIIFLFPVSLISVFSSFFLIKKIIKSEKAAFLGALLYSFNTYFLKIQNGHLTIGMAYALAPLVFLLFINLLENKKIKDAIIFSLIFCLMGYYELRITYIIFFILFFYLIFQCLFKKKSKKEPVQFLKFSIISAVIITLLNLFWVFPAINTTTSSIGVLLDRSLFGNKFLNISYAFTLFYPFWNKGELIYFITQKIPILIWGLPVFIFLSSLFCKKNKDILFFLIISLLGILLTKQASLPFLNLYLWLYNNFPGFNLFREASKFFILIALGYSVLFSFVFLTIFNLFKKKYLANFFFILITILLLFNSTSLITGKIGKLFVARDVPKDYSIFKEYILDQSEYFRTFWSPHVSRWGFYTNQNPKISNVGVVTNEWKNVFNYKEIGDWPKQNQIINVFNFSFSNQLFDFSSVKYVVVPIQDIENDDDFFVSYGGKEDSNIRNWYISELDKIEWLKKINIGTENLVIYENEDYKPPIFTTSQLFNFSSFANLEKKYNFINNNLNKEFLFTVFDEEKDNKNLIEIKSVFEDINNKDINDNIFSSVISEFGKNNELYINSEEKIFYAFLEKDKINFYTKEEEKLLFNNQQILNRIKDKKIVGNYTIQKEQNYYLEFWGAFFPLLEGVELQIKTDKEKNFEIYSEKENIFVNGSFENGLWKNKVSDCNKYDDNPIIAMNLNQEEKSEGNQSLQLEATRHIACTSQKISITEPGEYVLSFDYQSPNAKQAGFYFIFNDKDKTTMKNKISIVDNNWQKYVQKIVVPENTTQATFHFYAYQLDGETNIINRYDNVQLVKLDKVSEVYLPEKNEFIKNSIELKDGENIFNYQNDNYNYKNIIINSSFESGFWADKVGDCNNYDSNSLIVMNLNKNEKSDGEQSLQLEATRHFACTSNKIPVKNNSVYLFSFDYQGENTNQAGYYIGFNDNGQTKFSEKIAIKNKDWNTFEKKIIVPSGADTMTLYIYAYESDKKENNVVRYDNFKLIEIPDLSDSYYLVSEPKQQLVEPASTTFDLLNPTKKLVHIKGAIKPFFLAMSESYHDQWQLQMNNEKIQGFFEKWWPFVKPDKISDEYHYKLNDFLNAWYVDPAILCANNNSACKLNQDGSYDLEMVIEFWPQRWFYLGLLISGTTLVGCLGYLAYYYIRRRKDVIPAKVGIQENLR